MPLVDRSESVLVVVDTQPGFFARSEPERAAALDAVEKALWLAAVARELEIPAVVTEEAPEDEGATEPRLLERLGPAAPVMTKPAFGLAGCPDIVHEILQTKRSTAVLTGFETDVCVLQSAVGLKDMGFRDSRCRRCELHAQRPPPRVRAAAHAAARRRDRPREGHRLRVDAHGRRRERDAAGGQRVSAAGTASLISEARSRTRQAGHATHTAP